MKAEPKRKPALKLGDVDHPLPRSRTALLLVDFINPLRFVGAEDLAPPALEAARATAAFKQRLAADGVPALYANDNYGQWRSEFSQLLRHCRRLKGEAGQIARLLKPAPADLALLKPRHSAFLGTPLELLLSQMQVRRLIIVGLAADICIQLTAMDAHLRGYRMWIPADCTAAESPAAKQAALDYMQRILRADIRPSAAKAR
jgi:nicotinamidase-related amidase